MNHKIKTIASAGLLFLLLMTSFSVSSNTDCDCLVFPFKPAPPCHDKCVLYHLAIAPLDLMDDLGIDRDLAQTLVVIREELDDPSSIGEYRKLLSEYKYTQLLDVITTFDIQGAGTIARHDLSSDLEFRDHGDALPTYVVTETELRQFAEAKKKITSIQQDFSGRLQDIDDPERAHELQIEANEEMTKAVESAGLDLLMYDKIATATQEDEAIKEKVSAILDELESEG